MTAKKVDPLAVRPETALVKGKALGDFGKMESTYRDPFSGELRIAQVIAGPAVDAQELAKKLGFKPDGKEGKIIFDAIQKARDTAHDHGMINAVAIGQVANTPASLQALQMQEENRQLKARVAQLEQDKAKLLEEKRVAALPPKRSR